MRLTVQEYLDLMTHGAGETPPSAVSLLKAFNRAGRRLVNAARWSWRTTGPVRLSTVAGEQTVPLPSDFRHLLSLTIDTDDGASVYARCLPSTVEQIMRCRESLSVVSAGVLLFAVDGSEPGGGEEHARRLLHLWPTPSADALPRLMLTYRRGWRTLTDAEQTSGVPDIPEDFEDALVSACRAAVWHLQNESECQSDRDFERAVAELVADDLPHPDDGPIVGSVAPPMDGSLISEHPFSTVNL